jgi:hypothetical protein
MQAAGLTAALFATSSFLALCVSASTATGAITSMAHIDGIYRIVSTDCYFSGGKCSARFDIEQSGNVLFDRSDPLFHGRVLLDHVRVGEIYPPGTSEDSWTASGLASNGGKTVHGTFTDGIGGSGTFTMTFVSP